jgi:hypothetical protein
MIASGREAGVRTDLTHGPSEIWHPESPASQMFVILSFHPLSFFFVPLVLALFYTFRLVEWAEGLEDACKGTPEERIRGAYDEPRRLPQT